MGPFISLSISDIQYFWPSFSNFPGCVLRKYIQAFCIPKWFVGIFFHCIDQLLIWVGAVSTSQVERGTTGNPLLDRSVSCQMHPMRQMQQPSLSGATGD